MRYLSVCSGIEAATVAWHPLGWQPAAFAEIDSFPSEVLREHYPDVPNAGDFTAIQGDEYGAVDLLVGGTPCQDFSIAGLRAGVAGDRGNLTLEFLRLAQRVRPRWLVWENVPGVYSSTSHDAPDPRKPEDCLFISNGDERMVADQYDADESHAFACFLAGLQELGYGFAYRTLDAQFFGVPQRRRRVFVVGHLGDWRRAAAVLFERHSLSGYPPPRREAGQAVTPSIGARLGDGGHGHDFDCNGGLIASTGDTAHCLNAGGMGRQDYETETLVAHTLRENYRNNSNPISEAAMLVTAPLTQNAYADRASEESLLITHALRAEGFDASEDGTGRGTPLVPIAIQERAISENPDAGPDGAGVRTDGISFTLEARTVPQAVAFDCKASGRNGFGVGDVSPTLRSMGHKDTHQNAGGQVAVVFDATQVTSVANRSNPQPGDPCHPLAAGAHAPALVTRMAVRRLTPRECERLQGFPDDYTLIRYNGKPAADGPRYKALGNSMAVPVMRWLGERIATAEAIA